MEDRKDKPWLELCKYIEKEFYNYEPDQGLQRETCLILRGLNRGQCVANNNASTSGNYPYEIVLLTFKANKMKILKALKGKKFTEMSQMSYMAAIVRKDINNIYTKYKQAQKDIDKIEEIDTNMISYQGAEYKSNNDKIPNNKIEEKFKELW